MPSSAKAGLWLFLAIAAGGCAAGRAATSSTVPPAEAAGSEPARAPSSGPRATPAAAGLAGPPTPAPTPAGAPAAAPAAARPRLRPPAGLVGTWRPTDAPPGAGAPASARPGADDIGLEFRADGTWTIAGASYRSAGTYRWLDADQIEMTIVQSNLSSQVGSVSRKRVSVDETDLALSVERQDGKGQAGGLAVVTRFRRAGR